MEDTVLAVNIQMKNIHHLGITHPYIRILKDSVVYYEHIIYMLMSELFSVQSVSLGASLKFKN